GEPDAVYGGGECGRDAVAELARVGEVLQHCHQAQYRADDAEGGRIDAHAFIHLGGAGVGVLPHVELHVHDAADAFRLAAIDHQLQRFLDEFVFFASDAGLEAEQSLLARRVAPIDDLGDEFLAVTDRRTQHPRKDPQRASHDLQGSLNENGRDGADHHDHESCGGHQRHDAGAFNTAPTRMALSASTTPMMLSMSKPAPYIPRPDSSASTSVWPEATSPLVTPGTTGPWPAFSPIEACSTTSPDRRERSVRADSSSSTSFITLRMIWPVRSW